VEDIFLAISVSFVAFVSTSIDNLFLLITLSLHPKYGAARVRAGYLLAVGMMLVICLILAQSVQLIPTNYIPYIGIVPLAIGLYELYQLVTGGNSPGGDTPDGLNAGNGTVWTIALIMLTHSWDSIGVLAPLLADTRGALMPWMAVSIVVAAALLIGLAQWAVSYPKIRKLLARIAPKILPFLLIGVGLYILIDTPTDVTMG